MAAVIKSKMSDPNPEEVNNSFAWNCALFLSLATEKNLINFDSLSHHLTRFPLINYFGKLSSRNLLTNTFPMLSFHKKI